MIKRTSGFETDFMSHCISFLLKNKAVCEQLPSYEFAYKIRTEIEDYKHVLEMQNQGLMYTINNFSGLEKTEVEEILNEFKHAKIQVAIFFDVLLSSYETLAKRSISKMADE